MVSLLSVSGMVGCTPSGHGRAISAERVVWAAQAVLHSVRLETTPFSTDQLVVMIGEPDVKMAVGDLLKRLKADAEYSSCLIEDTFDRIYRGYLRTNKQMKPSTGGWRESKDFMKLELWLYEWNDPVCVYIAGVIPEYTGWARSSYFLVKGDRVIDAGQITRPGG